MGVDPAIVKDRLQRLDKYLVMLRRLAELPRNAFLGDPISLGSAERYLQIAIEACLDIANHIIAAKELRSPSSYADAFAVLEAAVIIPTEFLPIAQRMARFRNRLVHLYWDVDAEVIYQILQTRLDDFERFQGYVLDLVMKDEQERFQGVI